MRVKWRTGSLKEIISEIRISKPIYFLMVLTLAVGLILLNTTHIECWTNLIKSEADLELIETLAAGGSSLFDDEVEEIMDQIETTARNVRKYYSDGRIACSMPEMFELAGMGYIQIVLNLIYVFGIAVALVPLFIDCDWKARYLIPANLAPVATMALLALACVKMNEMIETVETMLGSDLVEIVRTNELIALVIVSAFNLIFAACLVIGIVTSINSDN